MHVSLALRVQRQFGTFGAVEQAGADGSIGMDRHRAFGTVGRGHQRQLAALGVGVEVLLLVTRRDALAVGQDPDLQEMRRAVGSVVELAVAHAGAGAHALHVAGADHAGHCGTGFAVAHAVLVRQRAVEHIADDLHVAVAVCAEASAGGDAVFVDDTQITHAHVAGVVVVGEAEAMETLEPAVVGITTFGGLAQGDHGAVLCSDCVVVQCIQCRKHRPAAGCAGLSFTFK